MFCPNCGKDCGSNQFCIKCGVDLRRGAVQTLWSVGQPCPNCGGTKLEGNNCAFCGAQLVKEASYKPAGIRLDGDSYTIPEGEYGGIVSSVSLKADGLSTYRFCRFKDYVSEAAYDQLSAVLYIRPGSKWTDSGCFTIRSRQNQYTDLPTRQNMYGDRGAVLFDKESDSVFYHIFCMLKSLAPSSTQFIMDVPDAGVRGLDELEKCIDLNSYFERFNPYRENAVVAICAENGLKPDVAQALIDVSFDRYQKELYSKDLSAAIRDLNRVIRKVALGKYTTTKK